MSQPDRIHSDPDSDLSSAVAAIRLGRRWQRRAHVGPTAVNAMRQRITAPINDRSRIRTLEPTKTDKEDVFGAYQQSTKSESARLYTQQASEPIRRLRASTASIGSLGSHNEAGPSSSRTARASLAAFVRPGWHASTSQGTSSGQGSHLEEGRGLPRGSGKRQQPEPHDLERVDEGSPLLPQRESGPMTDPFAEQDDGVRHQNMFQKVAYSVGAVLGLSRHQGQPVHVDDYEDSDSLQEDALSREPRTTVLLIILGIVISALDFLVINSSTQLALGRKRLHFFLMEALFGSDNRSPNLRLSGVVESFDVDPMVPGHREYHSADFLQGMTSLVIDLLLKLCIFLPAIYITRLGPGSAGSGIPEIKAILASAVRIPNFFSMRTLLAKVCSLILVLAVGIPIGKEGPFVHTSAALAYQMMRHIGAFHSLLDEGTMENQVLSAAVGVGVASNFGAPIGGVLFTIEVTSTYYMISKYWQSMLAATVGAVFLHILSPHSFLAMFDQPLPQQAAMTYHPFEYIGFLMLGVCGGVMGVLFVYTHTKLLEFRRRLQNSGNYFLRRLFGRGILYPAAVLVFLGTISWAVGGFMQLTTIRALEDILFFDDLSDTGGKSNADNWAEFGGNVEWGLLIFATVTYLGSMLANSLTVPVGVFIPVIASGAALGRVYGLLFQMLCQAILGSDSKVAQISLAGYAVVGACALASGVTRTVSPAVILSEITGTQAFVLPSLLAGMIAVSLGNRMSLSFYDSMARLKRLPEILPPPDARTKTGKLKCIDILGVAGVPLFLIPEKPTLGRVLDEIHKAGPSAGTGDDNRTVAIVADDKQTHLIADIELDHLCQIVHEKLHSLTGDQRPELYRYYTSQSCPNVTLELLNNDDVITNAAPFHVVDVTPLNDMHEYFSMLRSDHIYVIRQSNSQLIGVISLRGFIKFIKSHYPNSAV
eukprot:Clim_evm13s249 gene=Clim_evmTU13s249